VSYKYEKYVFFDDANIIKLWDIPLPIAQKKLKSGEICEE
jgi:hypothetical protein